MKSSSSSSSSSGISAVGLLGVMFVGLKLAGIITWSWFWVLSPFWISFLLWIVVVVILFTVLRKYL